MRTTTCALVNFCKVFHLNCGYLVIIIISAYLMLLWGVELLLWKYACLIILYTFSTNRSVIYTYVVYVDTLLLLYTQYYISNVGKFHLNYCKKFRSCEKEHVSNAKTQVYFKYTPTFCISASLGKLFHYPQLSILLITVISSMKTRLLCAETFLFFFSNFKNIWYTIIWSTLVFAREMIC